MSTKTNGKIKRIGSRRDKPGSLHPVVRQLRPLVKSHDQEIDEAACMLHNVGATLAGNTQASDIDWLARWLYNPGVLSSVGLGHDLWN